MAVAVPQIDAALHLAAHLRDEGYAVWAMVCEELHEAATTGEAERAWSLFWSLNGLKKGPGLTKLPIANVTTHLVAVFEALESLGPDLG